MSRIRGLEAKVKKEIPSLVKNKNETNTACNKDDVEDVQVAQLLRKIPDLARVFNIHHKIGEGTFSSVYLASMREHADLPDSEKTWFAVKHHAPTTHPTRVAHELRCLWDIGGKNHVIGVDFCLRNLDNVVFVMPYIPHRKFSEYVGDMDADEVRQYMRALLTALRHVHTFNVIHRDVKPSNFVYDRKRKRYALVDFGLAQHTAPPATAQPPPAHQPLKRTREDDCLLPSAKRMALDLTVRPRAPVLQPVNTSRRVQPPPSARPACACAGLAGVCGECAEWAAPRANRAGTQGFRPPEVFLKYTNQTTAVDVWAAGVVLASLLTGRFPFFREADDLSALGELASYLGTDAMHRTAKALGRRLRMSQNRRGISLRKLAAYLAYGRTDGTKCTDCKFCPCLCRDPNVPEHVHCPRRTVVGFPDSAFALAERLLDPDPHTRITAADALRHPFLADGNTDQTINTDK